MRRPHTLPVRVFVLLSLVAALPAGCRPADPSAARGSPTTSQSLPDAPQWEPIFVGIDRASFARDKPRLMRVHAVRIDLRAPGVRVSVSAGNGERPLDADSAFVTTLLKKERCQVAINGSAFHPVIDEEGVPQEIVGLSLRQREAISDWLPGYSGIVFAGDTARVTTDGYDPQRDTDGLQGFGVALEAGKPITQTETDVHPRTAVGVSADGHVLYLVAIDGRMPMVSDGATNPEVGEILKLLGAENGLNLDGGGSTALAIEDASGNPKLLNIPVHRRMPMTQRPVPNALCVWAQRLDTAD